MQRLEQALAVQAQVELLGVDHHVVKEGIHGRAQHGQGLQAAGVVARQELRVGLGHEALQRGVQVLLGLLLQQLRVHVRIDFARLLEDVGHALVGGGQGRGLGQRGEGAHRGKIFRHKRQLLGLICQNCIDFLGCVTLLTQIYS